MDSSLCSRMGVLSFFCFHKNFMTNLSFQISIQPSHAHTCPRVKLKGGMDFQTLDPFWNLWSKPNPGISSKMLYPARLNHNLERKIGHEIFVKTEKTEYLSNQLTYTHFDRKFVFPIKFGTSEQIFIFFCISKMFQISGTATVKILLFWYTRLLVVRI